MTASFACGTWMVKKDLIEGEKWDEITRICKDAVKTMLGFELGHVGINCQDAGQAEQTAKALCAIFGFEYKAGNSSDFAGSAVECNKALPRRPRPHRHPHQQCGPRHLPPGPSGREV